MAKVSLPISNDFCPQCLYLYGTYKENGQPNYGLFCWATYCFDEGFRFVACIGEDKLTRDRIRATGEFSASIISKELLPNADFCGNHPGYQFDKSSQIESVKGSVLNVPVPVKSPWSFELKVNKILSLDDKMQSEIYVCEIKNVLAEEFLADQSKTFEEKLKAVNPVIAVEQKYFSVHGEAIGSWGDWKNNF
ncbi:MAG: flavin reductase [Massiliimalia sp.]|jgi:flavin reductase (DIM6/NTAB) family NADH-FMN oxidoreductase RutF